jgi:hypothetical protein
MAVISDRQRWCGYCVSSPGHESLSTEVGGAGRAAPRYCQSSDADSTLLFSRTAPTMYIHTSSERRQCTVLGLTLPYIYTVQSGCRIGKRCIAYAYNRYQIWHPTNKI